MRKEITGIEGGRATSMKRKATKTRTGRASLKFISNVGTRTGTPKKTATAARRAPVAKAGGVSQTTTDHETIRQWAESRGGTPASVKGTAGSKQAAALLRIDFPGFSGEGSLKPIEWDDWFRKFDEGKLAFLYQEKTKDGDQSRFFKLVKQ